MSKSSRRLFTEILVPATFSYSMIYLIPEPNVIKALEIFLQNLYLFTQMIMLIKYYIFKYHRYL
jgi:hypothetical protein